MTQQSRLMGFGMLSVLSILLWNPFIVWMNANLPADSVGNALGLFFWIVYPITVIFFVYMTLNALFQNS